MFVGWLKQDGDTIALDDPLFTLEGEKGDGRHSQAGAGHLRILPGGARTWRHTLRSAPVIGHLVAEGEIAPSSRARTVEQAVLASAVQTSELRSLATREHQLVFHRRRPVVPNPAASPRARRVAEELAVDWTKLTGTGSTGRIRERDVRSGRSWSVDAGQFHEETYACKGCKRARNTVPVTLVTTADASNLVQLYRQFKVVGTGWRGHSDYRSPREVVCRRTAIIRS